MTDYPTHDAEGYPLAGPRVGDAVWRPWDAETKTGGNYSTIVELAGWTEEDEPRLRFRIEDSDGTIHLLAVRMPEPVIAAEKKPRRPRTKLSAVERRDVAQGTKCRHGHDLTGLLPNGRPALYVSPKGVKACGFCRAAAVEAWKARQVAAA